MVLQTADTNQTTAKLGRCIIVGKHPMLSQLSAEESACLRNTVPDRWREINKAAQAHQATLTTVINF